MSEEYIKVSDVARILRISRGVAYRMVQTGEIPSYRFGRSYRIARADLEEWIARQRVGQGDDDWEGEA